VFIVSCAFAARQESVIDLLKLASRLKRFASLQNPVRDPFAASFTLSYSLLPYFLMRGRPR
jgi:hypothetical protein